MDDEDIELQESLDSFNTPNSDDSPLTEIYDEHIGLTLQVPVAGEMKKGLGSLFGYTRI